MESHLQPGTLWSSSNRRLARQLRGTTLCTLESKPSPGGRGACVTPSGWYAGYQPPLGEPAYQQQGPPPVAGGYYQAAPLQQQQQPHQHFQQLALQPQGGYPQQGGQPWQQQQQQYGNNPYTALQCINGGRGSG
jgi:hypothetical protein